VRSAEAGLPRLLLEKIPFLVLTVGSSVITMVAQKAFIQPITPQARLTNALSSYAAYLDKTFWPSGLSIYYPHRGYLIPFWEVILVIALLASLTILVIYLARRFPYLAFGWFWYIGTLVPVIGLVQVGAQAMADRYTYVPLIGIFIAVSWGIGDLAQRWALPRWVLPVCSTTVLLVLAALTWTQLGYWKNSISLYRKAISVTDKNYLIMSNLGAELFSQKQYQEAMFYFSESIRAEPRFELGYYQIGNLLMLHGDCRNAVPYYQQAIAIKPDYIKAIAELKYCVHDLSVKENVSRAGPRQIP